MAVLALVIFGAMLAGCASSAGYTAKTTDPSDPPSPPPIALVAGTVFDDVTGIGIKDAVVKLGDRELTTDRCGCFSFGRVDLPMEFTITFSAEFYEAVSSWVDRSTISRGKGWDYWFAVGLVRDGSAAQASTSVMLLQPSW